MQDDETNNLRVAPILNDDDDHYPVYGEVEENEAVKTEDEDC